MKQRCQSVCQCFTVCLTCLTIFLKKNVNLCAYHQFLRNYISSLIFRSMYICWFKEKSFNIFRLTCVIAVLRRYICRHSALHSLSVSTRRVQSSDFCRRLIRQCWRPSSLWWFLLSLSQQTSTNVEFELPLLLLWQHAVVVWTLFVDCYSFSTELHPCVSMSLSLSLCFCTKKKSPKGDICGCFMLVDVVVDHLVDIQSVAYELWCVDIDVTVSFAAKMQPIFVNRYWGMELFSLSFFL